VKVSSRGGRAAVLWAALGLAAFVVLPWSRGGAGGPRLPAGLGLAAAGDGFVAGAGLALLAGLALALTRGSRRTGRVLALAGGLGLLLSVTALVGSKAPAGLGAGLVTGSLLTLAGLGLAQATWVRGGGFVGGAILWTGALVALFVVYPLIAILQASVVVDGRLTTGPLVRTLRSPIFLLFSRNTGEMAPVTAALGGALVGLATGAVGRLRLRRPRPDGRAPDSGRAFDGRQLERMAAYAAAGAAIALLLIARGALRNSLLLGAAVGIASTALGLALALLEARSRLPGRRLLAPLAVLPIITPAFVLGLAFIYLFGRRGSITHGLLGLDTGIFFGPLGVGVAQVAAFTPIAFLVLSSVVRGLDPGLEEAARTLRATPGTLLRTVTWPLLRPGLANAMLLVMIESLADFGNPLLLGGGVPFLSTEVFLAIEGRFDPHEAAVYGVVLLVLVLALFLLQRRWLGQGSVVTMTGRPGAGRPTPLPAPLDWTLTGVAVLYLGLAGLLYGSLVFGGFVRVWGIDHRLTTEHYRSLVTTGIPVLLDTALLAAVAAVPASLLGFLIAYLTARRRFVGRGALEFCALLSYALPGTVMGIGYILAFNKGGLRLTGTAAILVAAFVFRGMPVGIRGGMAALAQVDPALEEASATLRAGVPRTLRTVLWPLVRPAVLTGLIYCFVRAMTAVSQVVFLVSPGHDLVTVLLLSWAEYGHLGRGAALATALVVLLAAVILPVERLGRRRLGVEAAASG
jgi:iron(III) transport system permease protein